MHDIAIVYVNYFMKDDILRSLEGLLADVKDSGLDVAVVVADNSENRDGIREMLAERFPMIRYLDCGGNRGFGQGNVAGFRTAPARYYFALNPDTVILENSRTVERIVRWMDEHPRIGAAGTKLINPDGSVQPSCYRFDWKALATKPMRHFGWDRKCGWVERNSARLLMRDFDHGQTRPVDWALGAALVVRRQAAEQAGWFDSRYFMYMEDADWCRELWRRGWPVYYVHDIAIVHRHERGSVRTPGFFRALFYNPLAREHAKSWAKFLWKWRGEFKYYAS